MIYDQPDSNMNEGSQPNVPSNSSWQASHSIIPKQEPMDEDRVDSGVSDNYSLSPGSETSQDYNKYCAYTSYSTNSNMNTNPSTSSIYSSRIVPLSMEYPLQVPICTTAQGPRENDDGIDQKPEMQTEDFNNHSPLRNLERATRAITPPSTETNGEKSEDNDQSFNTPKLNSHGKVKTYKCKQCKYIAYTKVQFWEHSNVHIKAEKRLTCNKCPFVTEYKHHLEYHMRNHTGSKPYKCSECPYNCVNKSMLNSHMKSHSSVYQYRCADCTYVSKYCHSLKQHLRKYRHQPAMVLNADGTPNPYPIIDVYGTRRGPKQKSVKPATATADIPKIPQAANNEQAQSAFAASYAMLNSAFHFFSGLSNSPPLPFPIPYPMENVSLNNSSEDLSIQQQPQLSCSPPSHSPTLSLSPQPSLSPTLPLVLPPYPLLSLPPLQPALSSPPLPLASPRPVLSSPPLSLFPSNPSQNENVALDLSKPEAKSPTQKPTKHRRKGRAYKLELPANNENSDDENNEDISKQRNQIKEPESSSSRETSQERVNVTVTTEEVNSSNNNNNNNNNNINYNDFQGNCPHCLIQYGNAAMYSIHMGFHGYKDPFYCNKCGNRYSDNLSFYMHTLQIAHS